MKLSYISLGCSKNQVDIEFLIGELSDIGFVTETDPTKCDAVIINTCGFIKSAVEEAIENILTMSQTIPEDAKLIVTGCMAERYKDDILREIPEIDFVSGVGKLSEVAKYLKSISNFDKEKQELSRVITNYPYYAYLKISEGCNNKCSYCTIPLIRGTLKSRSVEDILKEAEYLINKGVKEIIIVSQDTTKYSYDLTKSYDLVPLMDKLTTKFPTTLFRLLYLNPDGITEELIRFIAERDNIIKYFEVPVQHASPKILKDMNRKSSYEMIVDVFNKIRSIIPEAVIRTTFIVGFPTESIEDFELLEKFIIEQKPDFAGFFPYSKEEGTKSYNIENNIDFKTINQRIKRLEKLQKKNSTSRLNSMKKDIFSCFIEKENDEFAFILEGRTLFQSPEIDGKLYVTDGVADKGYGPYKCKINKVVYPDIYVTLINE